MLVVVAVGGNALLERGEQPDPRTEHRRVRATAQALAELARTHSLVICHGNGPHMGILATESENDPSLVRPYPLDVIGAETQGMIGYSLSQALDNAGAGPITVVVTRTVIDESDPAFADPVKAIGPLLTSQQSSQLTEKRGWKLRADGDRWRRVVASPRPQSIIEIDAIRLLSQHSTVICAGGGGVPVAWRRGDLIGVEAVVDKDASAELLATELDADMLIILTDVDSVLLDYGLPSQRPLNVITVDELADLDFPAGTMAPKVAACIAFVTRTGKEARIGALRNAAAVVSGSSGTRIVPTSPASVSATGPGALVQQPTH